MRKIINYVRREPVLVAGEVQAGVTLAVAFGLPLSDVQQGALLAFSAATLALIVRRHVSPVYGDDA